jgi:hypothetical protein
MPQHAPEKPLRQSRPTVDLCFKLRPSSIDQVIADVRSAAIILG